MNGNPTGRCITLILTLASLNVAAHAQTSFLGGINPFRHDGRGLQWTGISATGGYSTTTAPGAYHGAAAGSSSAYIDYGLSTGVGWSRQPHWGSTAISYGFSYNRFNGLDDLSSDSMSHSLSLSFGRELSSKWNFNASVSGSAMDMEQSMFRPAPLGNVASAAATFDDLVGSILAGRGSNAGLNAALTPPLLTDAPARDLLFGSRMASVGASIGIGYAATSRLNISASVSGNRAIPLSDDEARDTNAESYALLNTTTAGGGISANYSVSSRTFVGASLSTNLTRSNYFDGRNVQINLSIGRTLSRRTFVQASAGTGRIVARSTAVPVSQSAQWLASASLGYKTYSHAFFASASRNLGDPFGIAGGTSASFGGGWNWSRPGRSWSVGSSVSYQRISGSVFSSPESVQLNNSFGKQLTRQISMSVNYAYMRTIATVNPNAIYPDPYRSGLHSVRVGLHWMPYGLW